MLSVAFILLCFMSLCRVSCFLVMLNVIIVYFFLRLALLLLDVTIPGVVGPSVAFFLLLR